PGNRAEWILTVADSDRQAEFALDGRRSHDAEARQPCSTLNSVEPSATPGDAALTVLCLAEKSAVRWFPRGRASPAEATPPAPVILPPFKSDALGRIHPSVVRADQLDQAVIGGGGRHVALHQFFAHVEVHGARA